MNRVTILKVLWVLVAVAGVITGLMATIVPLGNGNVVHAGVRAEQRLSEIDQAPSGFTPTLAQYKESCADAKRLGDTIGTMLGIGVYCGGAVVLLAAIGIALTSDIRRRETIAQQRAAPLPSAPRTGPSEGAR